MLTKPKLLIFGIIILIVFVAGLIVFFLLTTQGSSLIVKTALSRYWQTKDIDIGKIDGSLQEKLVFQDLELNNINRLPPGSKLKIQKLEVRLTSFDIDGLELKLHNAKLQLPASDTIFFYGELKDGDLNLDIYSRLVNVSDIINLFPENQELKRLSGKINDLDITIKQELLEPRISGSLYIDELLRNEFSMTDSATVINLDLKDITDNLQLHGEILLKSGTLSGPKTAMVNLGESKIMFNGSPSNPWFNLKATSKVERVNIEISLKGNLKEPILKLSSDPSLPQEQLLVMLATNKSWEATQSAMSQNEVSPDVARDFIDYFVFAGAGSKIMQRLGITDISITYDQEKQGIGLSKEVTKRGEVSYAIEQARDREKDPTTTHTVGGEYKITETVSIGAEKEIKVQDEETQQAQEEQEKPDDKVMIKFKKEF